MPRILRFSTRTRTGLGAILAYSFFESYMYVQTQRIIQERKNMVEFAGKHDDSARLRFQSATVNGMFVNPFDEYRPQTALEFIYIRILEVFECLCGNKVEVHNLPISSAGEISELKDYLETFEPNYDILRRNSQILGECINSGDFNALFILKNHAVPLNQQLLFTWLGQSCALIQLSGMNILTDPIFGNYLFPNQLGPKRLVSSPMSIEDVNYATNNNLHIVLVSHNHPDHLEMASAKLIGNNALWIVPLGLKLALAREGIINVIEMDWWDSIPLNKYLFKGYGSAFPDTNGQSIIYHAGDTGFSGELFDEIGNKYGPVHFSLLPIGQYCPSWHQKPRHISPEECMKIASKIKASHIMGVHFGTFKLSSEPILEPKFSFLKLAGLSDKSQFYNAPEFGLTYEYDLNLPCPGIASHILKKTSH